MRLNLRRAMGLAIVGVLATAGHVLAGEDELDRGIFKVLYSKEARRAVSEPVPFSRILAVPQNYLNVYVRTWVRFHREENLETPEYTPFNREKYVNFSVWAADAKLWSESERLNDMPFMFAEKDDVLVYAVSQLKTYDQLLVYGLVRTVFLGRPWIEVISIEKASRSTLNDAILTHISVGEGFEQDGLYRHAVDEYDRALQYNLTDDLKGELWKRKGTNYLRTGDYPKAARALAEARVRLPGDAAVHLWLADALARDSKYGEALAAARRSLSLQGRQAKAYALIGYCWREAVLAKMDSLGIRVNEKSDVERRRRLENVRPRDRFRFGVSLEDEKVQTHYSIGQVTKRELREMLEAAVREGEKSLQLDATNAEAGRWLEATRKALADFDARMAAIEAKRAEEATPAPEPAKPEPAKPEPVKPVVKPAPAPVKPAPAPVKPAPKPEPPKPVAPKPVAPKPPEPVKPAPAPVKPAEPAKPAPAPVKPAEPAKPAPVPPKPADPKPAAPK